MHKSTSSSANESNEENPGSSASSELGRQFLVIQATTADEVHTVTVTGLVKEKLIQKMHAIPVESPSDFFRQRGIDPSSIKIDAEYIDAEYVSSGLSEESFSTLNSALSRLDEADIRIQKHQTATDHLKEDTRKGLSELNKVVEKL